jgi:hypothetical protein
MQTLKVGFFSILIFCSIFLMGQSNQSDCRNKTNVFTYGEQAEYTIYYNWGAMWVSAGSVTFRVDSTAVNSKPFYKISGVGQSFKKYDWLYKVRDNYEVIAEVAPFRPIRFKRDVKEGSNEIYEDYVFNHKTGKVITLRKPDKKSELEKDTVDFSKCAFDVLSMIYHARNLDYSKLKVNDVIPITVFLDNEEHSSYIRFLGREELEVKGMGVFKTIKFKPLLIEGTIFNAGEDMTVWVTDDADRVPLLIDTPILVGSIKARIKSIEGRNIQLKSKIRDLE